jgi:hypothetical protein
MAEPEQARQYHYFAPPTYLGLARVVAGVAAKAIDLTTLTGWPGNQVSSGSGSGGQGSDPNPLGHFITITADGANSVYVVLADTFAHATAIDTTTVTTPGTAGELGGSGVTTPTNTTQACIPIPNGTTIRVKLPVGMNPQTTPFAKNSPCRFLGYITASGTANLIVGQASP